MWVVREERGVVADSGLGVQVVVVRSLGLAIGVYIGVLVLWQQDEDW